MRREKGGIGKVEKERKREEGSGRIGRKDTKKRRREEGMRIGVEGRSKCSSPGSSTESRYTHKLSSYSYS